MTRFALDRQSESVVPVKHYVVWRYLMDPPDCIEILAVRHTRHEAEVVRDSSADIQAERYNAERKRRFEAGDSVPPALTRVNFDGNYKITEVVE